MKTTISYAIPVCNEHREIDALLKLLFSNFQGGLDEIVILKDFQKVTKEVDDVLQIWEKNFALEYGLNHFKIYSKPLNGNFAEFKNYLNSKCTKDYIFQIDADEQPTIGLIGDNLRLFLEMNKPVDLFIVPRKNTIQYDEEIEHDEFMNYCKQQGWFYKDGLINWPDNQARIYRNDPAIKWYGKVHEQLKGFKTCSVLVAEIPFEQIENYHLQHHKSFQRQKKQNEFYSNL